MSGTEGAGTRPVGSSWWATGSVNATQRAMEATDEMSMVSTLTGVWGEGRVEEARDALG